MDLIRFLYSFGPEPSPKYKVRQCSQCQGDTEFYCNTCKHDLCLLCKETHVFDLDTKHHDVVIYREKYKNVFMQEPCVIHPDRAYDKYCQSCELPICVKCTEIKSPNTFPFVLMWHRTYNLMLPFFQWTKHIEHNILDIRTSYETNRFKHREIIHNIRSDTIYNCCFILSRIKSDLGTCHKEISNYKLQMSAKAHILRNRIDAVIRNVKVRQKKLSIESLHQHKQKIREMKKRLTRIEHCEYRLEQFANKPVKNLFLLKKTSVPQIKKNHFLIRFSPVKEINIEDVINKLSEIQIIETEKRNVREKCVLKLSTPMLYKSMVITNVSIIRHMSHVSSDRVWISDKDNLILTNTKGETLYHLTDIGFLYGGHTVDITGDLIYIDKDNNKNKLSIDNRKKSTLIKKANPWIPLCVYCSPSNGDLLVGMKIFSKAVKLIRYNSRGYNIQTIQHDNTGQELYRQPIYITENQNGDVIVSDLDRGVVVVGRGGRHRFSYKEHPSGSRLLVYGLCTDALSHILVCDYSTLSVHMIDKDDYFLSMIQQQQGVFIPMSLRYDDGNHLMWAGSGTNNRVCVYKYITRQDSLRGIHTVKSTSEVFCTDKESNI